MTILPAELPCSSCGTPVPITPLLAAALDDIPTRLGAVNITCPACAKLAEETTPLRTVRVYRVSLVFSELAGVDVVQGGEEDGREVERWEDIGGFNLRGSGHSVREFVEQQAGEWGRRMEAIVAMADSAVEVAGDWNSGPQKDVPSAEEVDRRDGIDGGTNDATGSGTQDT